MIAPLDIGVVAPSVLLARRAVSSVASHAKAGAVHAGPLDPHPAARPTSIGVGQNNEFRPDA